jgi:hypothetical protein
MTSACWELKGKAKAEAEQLRSRAIKVFLNIRNQWGATAMIGFAGAIIARYCRTNFR